LIKLEFNPITTMKKSLIKILLVEDDTLLSATLAKVLEANHYTIDRASDGQAGALASNRSGV
jgi:DNA-binding response OmpR family regulator